MCFFVVAGRFGENRRHGKEPLKGSLESTAPTTTQLLCRTMTNIYSFIHSFIHPRTLVSDARLPEFLSTIDRT
jgi:hypothetical protein